MLRGTSAWEEASAGGRNMLPSFHDDLGGGKSLLAMINELWEGRDDRVITPSERPGFVQRKGHTVPPAPAWPDVALSWR